MMFWKTSYTAVPTASEADASESLENPIRWSGKSRHLVQHLPCLIASVMALIVVGVVAFLQLSKPENVSPETCGNSSSEALSLGCSFDVISFAWLPVRCFDKELVDEFLALKDWNWYLDAGAQQTADFVSVAAGAYDELYVTQEYHMYHCTYMWRKMHRAILAGDVLDGYIGDMHHTAHCEMQILDRSRTLDEVSTTIYTKYVKCPVQQEFRGRWGWYRIINGQRVHRDPRWWMAEQRMQAAQRGQYPAHWQNRGSSSGAGAECHGRVRDSLGIGES